MKISFMRLKWINISLSITLITFMFVYTFKVHNGFKEGIDFAGGTKIEIQKNDVVTLEKLKALFKNEKIDVTLQFSGKESVEYITLELDSHMDSVLNSHALTHEKEILEAGLSVNVIDYLKYLIIKNISTTEPSKVVFFRC